MDETKTKTETKTERLLACRRDAVAAARQFIIIGDPAFDLLAAALSDYAAAAAACDGVPAHIDSAAGEADATGPFAERVTTAIREHFETAWSQTRGLLASWESIASDLRTLYHRADDALDNISTAVDQFRPDVNDPFVKHVVAVLASRDSAAPLPALLSDVPMGG